MVVVQVVKRPGTTVLLSTFMTIDQQDTIANLFDGKISALLRKGEKIAGDLTDVLVKLTKDLPAPLALIVAPFAPIVAPPAPIMAPPVIDSPERSRSAARAASRPAADEMRKSDDRPPRPQRSKAAAGVAAATAAVRGNARASTSENTHR